MNNRPIISALGLWCFLGIVLPSIGHTQSIGTAPSSEQRETALRTTANFKHLGFQVIAARLALNTDTSLAWRQFDSLLQNPVGDIFWMYPATGFYFYCKDKLSTERKEQFRNVWKTYTPYRGDTENHFLMYYASLFLFSQEWPELEGTDWFNGKSSHENHLEAEAYLRNWIDETVHYGLTEWDSPRYLYYYLAPLLTLYDFTEDAELKKQFGMMLEYQLADYAADYLEGNYCGAHSRDGDGSVIDPRKAEATSYAQFYFEDTITFVLPDLAYAAMSSFECPEIIRGIAHDRNKGFVHRELKRSRAKMRYSDERYTPVRKYSWMTPSYCLGSIQGGLQQPIQQHSWDITFAADRPNNTVFALHPQSSAEELGMFFPEEPELMEEGILQSKASYGTPDKWIGGSPYERLFQYRNTLLATYRIPVGTRYPHVDLFLPRTLDTLIRRHYGWIVGRMGDAFFGIAFRNPNALIWTEEGNGYRVRSTDLETFYVVECASAQEISFYGFLESLASSPMRQQTTISPSGIIYTTLTGETLEIKTSPVEPDSTFFTSPDSYTSSQIQHPPLFAGPHLKSKYNSGVLELFWKGQRRILDFPATVIR